MSVAFWGAKAQARQEPVDSVADKQAFPALYTEPANASSSDDWTPFRSKRTSTNGAASEGKRKEPNSKSKSSLKAGDKHTRPLELEADVQKKDGYIGELVAQVDEKDRRIAGLERDLDVKGRDIQKLQGQVDALQEQPTVSSQFDEKDRRISDLEVDLDAKHEYIQELEDQVVALQQQAAASSHNPELDRHLKDLKAVLYDKDRRIKELEDEVDILKQQTLVREEVDGVNQHKEADALANHAESDGEADKEPEGDFNEQATHEDERIPEPETPHQSEHDLQPESPNLSNPPTLSAASEASQFDSPELPALPKSSQVATNDVKPAPKLTFPIRNGGKVDTKAVSNAPASNPVALPSSWVAGKATQDIRDMSLLERAELFHGPSISVIIGAVHIRGVPKHMFMAVSSKVRDYFTENPRETYIAFRDREIAVPVMNLIKDWLTNMGSCPKVYSLKLREKIVEDLAIRRDCLTLGMDKYVAHFTRQYCDKVRKEFFGLDNIAIIEKNTGNDDALWDCLCNNLANMRLHKRIPDPDKFEEFLKQHPRVAQGMAKVDSRITANRSSASSQASDTPKKKNVGTGEKNGSVKGDKRKGKYTPPSNSPNSRSLRVVSQEEAVMLRRR